MAPDAVPVALPGGRSRGRTVLARAEPLAQATSHLSTAGQPNAVKAASHAELVPERLLDGGEIVILAIKPSLWFILFASARWVAFLVLIAVLAPRLEPVLPWGSPVMVTKAAVALAAARLGFATLEWVARLYVLTNRRVMRVRGIFNVDLFECSLLRIENTHLTFAWYERIFGLGSIWFATAGTAGCQPGWVTVARPLEVHEQIRAAIARARGQGPAR